MNLINWHNQLNLDLNLRDAATREERCNIPKKYFLKIGQPPDSMLTSKNNKTCIESDHPSIFICDTQPESDHERNSHRKLTDQLKIIKKRGKNRKSKINKKKREKKLKSKGKRKRKQKFGKRNRKSNKKYKNKRKGKNRGNRKRKRKSAKKVAKSKKKKVSKKN